MRPVMLSQAQHKRLPARVAELERQLAACQAELKESLAQQTATSEILSVISRSPTDIQPVLDAIVNQARRLCETPHAVVMLAEGDELVSVAGGWGGRPIG